MIGVTKFIEGGLDVDGYTAANLKVPWYKTNNLKAVPDRRYVIPRERLEDAWYTLEHRDLEAAGALLAWDHGLGRRCIKLCDVREFFEYNDNVVVLRTSDGEFAGVRIVDGGSDDYPMLTITTREQAVALLERIDHKEREAR